ncbi:MAG: DMSO/TMAO reductase YedYZ molybdopterin-dependent catalytic subunit [Verrucomicrobiales bacterium]|jgi:DMSO/TMAO reductase YedYZ molybdopterin-dependent catalytic subunit
MKSPQAVLDDHSAATRRFFLRLAAGGSAGLAASRLFAENALDHPAVLEAIAGLSYLTPDKEFRYVGRIQPKISEMSEEERAEAGLTRDTWKLEVFADPDPDSEARVRRPMRIEDDTAFTFQQLLELGKTKAVRYLKVMTCNNIADPLGMGLWEGVPLRDLIWKAGPDPKVRRVFYHGFHREDPKWLFRSSLSINRVFEDPPGDQPVIVCYKLNGKWLSPDRGGPVRILVPDSYGFKSVKWLRQIQLTSKHTNNDTYAEKGNDVDSQMKSYARILNWPKTAKAGEPIPLTGVAQSGGAGLTKVQFWLKPAEDEWPFEDRYFETAPWQDAEILPPPDGNWGDEIDSIQSIPHQIGEDGKPDKWPLRNSIVHYAALLPAVKTGEYEIRVRTIDENGVAQPMPRPFQKSGGNAIQALELKVVSS